MSSTNRGQKGGGDAEFFPTPTFVVHRLLEKVFKCHATTRLPGGLWLEPSAGDGSIIRAVNEWTKRAGPRVNWTAIEIREECRDDLMRIPNVGADTHTMSFQEWLRKQDALQPHLRRLYDVAILNPPFSQALIFVQGCLNRAEWVVCLQRINWLFDAKDNREFFRDRMPDVYAIGRVDFDGRGGDSASYAWFVWPPVQDRKRSQGGFEILSDTPREQRMIGTIPPPRQSTLF